jgi:Fucose 4-O-acetylase and related acetyltransferases
MTEGATKLENSNLKNPVRMAWADIAKGFGILLVVAGHMPTIPSNVRLWIFSFHMPLFYYLSGYFAKPNKKTMKLFMLSKLKSLLLPYLVYSMVFILCDGILLRRDFSVIQSELIDFLRGQGGNDILWFLFSLFTVEILFDGIYRCFSRSSIHFVAVCLCVILGYICGRFAWEWGNFLKISSSLYAIGFYALGYYINKKGNFKIMRSRFIKTVLFAAASVINIFCSIVLIYFNSYILDINSDRSFDILGTYGIAICGVYCVIRLSMNIEHCKVSKPLQYIGKNSIHFYPITGYVPVAIVSFTENMGIATGYLYKIATKIIGFGVATIVIELRKRCIHGKVQ